ncbi:DUF1566 domain-containing protein [Oxalobacteraceae bacterium A2-2]
MNQDTRTIPATVGALFEGGYYAGQILVDGKPYALIMAGAAGELSGRWNASNDSVAGTTSRADGLANTAAMAAAGSKLAQRVQALEIGGVSGWYIPARDELEILYRAFKPSTTGNWAGEGENPSSIPAGAHYTGELPAQTTVEVLREDEPDALIPAWYWSSTQREAYPGRAWGQDFGNGLQVTGHKSYAGRVRAVRRLPL